MAESQRIFKDWVRKSNCRNRFYDKGRVPVVARVYAVSHAREHMTGCRAQNCVFPPSRPREAVLKVVSPGPLGSWRPLQGLFEVRTIFRAVFWYNGSAAAWDTCTPHWSPGSALHSVTQQKGALCLSAFQISESIFIIILRPYLPFSVLTLASDGEKATVEKLPVP